VGLQNSLEILKKVVVRTIYVLLQSELIVRLIGIAVDLCQKNSKLSLNGTCQLCLEDGVAVPGRKCTSIYDCCSSNKLYSEGLGFDDYSICQPLEPNGVNYCEACIPQNETCTEWNHCCGGYTCDNSGTHTCSIPPETGEDEEAPDDEDQDAELAAVVGNDTNPNPEG